MYKYCSQEHIIFQVVAIYTRILIIYKFEIEAFKADKFYISFY